MPPAVRNGYSPKRSERKSIISGWRARESVAMSPTEGPPVAGSASSPKRSGSSASQYRTPSAR